MTSEQIKNVLHQTSAMLSKAAQENHTVNIDIPTYQMFGEIALQLAVINEAHAPRWVQFECEGQPVMIRADLVTCVWGWGYDKGCKLGFLGDERGQIVTETMAQVCAKLGIKQ